ncbi:MAG: GNAT family N-acetyltransferase [Pseudomonadota bacterium]
MIPDKLQTANLSLRPFALSDGPAVYEYWKSDPGWEKFNASVPTGFTASDADAWVVEMICRDRQYQPSWAILHERGVVGVVSLSFENGRRSASLGYGIHADLRGRGLCGEAIDKVLECAFSEDLDLQVYAHTDPGNSASIRVLKKMGFSEESAADDAGATFCLSRASWELRRQRVTR